LLPIILKIRLATMAMGGITAASSPMPLPASAVAITAAAHTASPVQISLWDENEHQAGAIVVWRDGATDEVTSNEIKRLFRCRTTHRQRLLAKQTLAMLADVSDRYAGKTVEYVSVFRVGGHESATSPHRAGRAIDFRIRGIKLGELRDYVWRTYRDVGVGWYPAEQFVHIDTRPVEHDMSWTFLHGVNHYHPYWAELARQPQVAEVAHDHRPGT
jgi:uncharacterized protein YcbK (DUF882 family)